MKRIENALNVLKTYLYLEFRKGEENKSVEIIYIEHRLSQPFCHPMYKIYATLQIERSSIERSRGNRWVGRSNRGANGWARGSADVACRG